MKRQLQTFDSLRTSKSVVKQALCVKGSQNIQILSNGGELL